jgi:regulator of replication initiation timing
MNKGLIKNVLIVFLISITAFSMVKYLNELKARYNLQDNLTKAQDEISALAQEKQRLLQKLGEEAGIKEQLLLKNAGLKDYLKASRNKIARLFQDKSRIRASLEDMSSKFSILKAENRALIGQHKRIYMENEQLNEKLSSVVELKKAIRELRTKKHMALGPEAEGNRGFLIKNGQLTTSEKIRIEVVPAQTKE